ncbi:hypothetical protein T440DRAFT_470131 [Plenodomus tracheiphilus IPT5]|uniref:Uncharacterized protein n=1 Tax=Plenodomus tracheiphilus IPT5 TaxID=1408161 RepID=A0A6A7B2D9_9PLEO|nr:hypothetical protein T440DRAFT_470131 [Plenodomus tracheiphilus IPT5]
MDTPSPLTVPSPFFTLPLELREQIYSLYHKPADRLQRNHILDAQGFFGGVYRFDFSLWRVNRQVYEEAKRVWRRENIFVKIGTPWPSAGMYRVYLVAEDASFTLDEDGQHFTHISSEGLMPIVCTDEKADLFNNHHAVVQITAPFHQAVPEHTVLVLLNDLHLFSQTWFYSALSYPMLNDRLSTTFILRDPNSTESNPAVKDQPPNIPLALQHRLLLPFEQVKGLYGIDIQGYSAEVSQELRRRMAIPNPTLVEYLDKATDLLIQGDAVLAANNPIEALDLYNQAFKAIHIIISGRTRRVLADVFFHEAITSGRYTGQTGMTVRVMLRLRLVARTVACYLALSQWDEAAYWGMRSIRIMREAMDTEFEDFLSEFLGGSDVGLIYMRTGIAFWKMERDLGTWGKEVGGYEGENDARSEALWVSAKRYLGRQSKEPLRRELEAYGVPREVVGMFRDEKGGKEGSVVAENGSGEE